MHNGPARPGGYCHSSPLASRSSCICFPPRGAWATCTRSPTPDLWFVLFQGLADPKSRHQPRICAFFLKIPIDRVNHLFAMYIANRLMGADNYGNLLPSLPSGGRRRFLRMLFVRLFEALLSQPDAERKQKLVPGGTVLHTRGFARSICNVNLALRHLNVFCLIWTHVTKAGGTLKNLTKGPTEDSLKGFLTSAPLRKRRDALLTAHTAFAGFTII
ncbi:hypothetical protein BDV28DRAFT_1503 [Aspergillus coremiiformis]|uniref:Uncharacterized protein n=1 Tax=Aspergillus coremiiformis TaxID=138285 RepID=A0A5N6ZHA3_9EURO|nr:hypothetical protein BDV28DRAFT_1503 [Aspergillus coremiiformis]